MEAIIAGQRRPSTSRLTIGNLLADQQEDAAVAIRRTGRLRQLPADRRGSDVRGRDPTKVPVGFSTCSTCTPARWMCHKRLGGHHPAKLLPCCPMQRGAALAANTCRALMSEQNAFNDSLARYVLHSARAPSQVQLPEAATRKMLVVLQQARRFGQAVWRMTSRRHSARERLVELHRRRRSRPIAWRPAVNCCLRPSSRRGCELNLEPTWRGASTSAISPRGAGRLRHCDGSRRRRPRPLAQPNTPPCNGSRKPQTCLTSGRRPRVIRPCEALRSPPSGRATTTHRRRFHS